MRRERHLTGRIVTNIYQSKSEGHPLRVIQVKSYRWASSLTSSIKYSIIR